MVFPAIPTVAAGRILTTFDTGGSTTHTFPDLTSLTKDAGDLLIAVIVSYQGSATNATFGTWGGGFTEFEDSSSTTAISIGCAYKWSTGSETGTFTVVGAAQDSAMFLMSIPGAHATTPPEAGGYTTVVGCDPGAFDPAGWAAEDTLWIVVAGCGETATGGSFLGISAAPASYTDFLASGITADVVGGVEGAVAFRQLNAASEDPGAFSNDTGNTRGGALVIAVRPVPGPTPVGATDLVTSWRVYAPVTASDLVTSWKVLVDAGTSPVGATDLTTNWRVLAQVTSDLATSWRVYIAVTSADLATSWRVYVPAGASDLVTSWRVLSSLTPVASDLVTSWRVSARIISDLATSWRVSTSVTSDLATSWRVFTPIAATDLATSWRVLQLVTAVNPSDLVTSWKVSALVGPSDLATSWKVLIPPYEPILVGLDHATTGRILNHHGSRDGHLEGAITATILDT